MGGVDFKKKMMPIAYIHKPYRLMDIAYSQINPLTHEKYVLTDK